MKLSVSKNDLKLIAIIVFVLLLGVAGWFYYSNSNFSFNRKAIAQLKEAKDDVRLKMYEQTSWENPEVNAGLVSGDQIFTGENSYALIEFNNQVRLNLKPNSLITITEMDDKLVMELERGSLDLENSAQGEIYLKENEEIRKIEPSAAVQKLSKTTEQKIVVEEKPTVAAEITGPENGQKVELGKNINFTFSRELTGDLEMARDATFSQGLKKVKLSEKVSSMSFTAEEKGTFFFRLVEDKLVSKSVQIEVFEHQMNEIVSPLNDSEIELKRLEPHSVTLTWKNVSEAPAHLKVLKDGTEMINQTVEKESFELTNVEAGTYQWGTSSSNKMEDSKLSSFKVFFEPLVAKNNKLSLSETRNNSLHLAFNNALKNEELDVTVSQEESVVVEKVLSEKYDLEDLKPGSYTISINSKKLRSKNPAIIQAELKSKSIHFDGLILGNKTEKVTEILLDKPLNEITFKYFSYLLPDNLVLKMTKDGADFSKMTKASFSVDELKLKLNGYGKYCVGAKVKDAAIAKFYSDDVFCVDIKAKVLIAKLDAPGNQIIKRNSLMGKDTYEVELPKNSLAKEYKINIYGDESKKNLIYSSKSKDNTFVWKSKKSGIFYYNYQLMDVNGNLTSESGVSKLIFPISPLSEWGNN